MNYGTMVARLKKLYHNQSWSVSRISRESGISKPTIARILNGHRVRDPKILARLGITRKWKHLDDLTPEQVKYIFDHRETMP